MATVSDNSLEMGSLSAEQEAPSDANEQQQERPRWAKRMSFLFAAIGAAVGLGNIWRFPYLCNKYGGGAFLIPYFLCLILVGHPILQLELSMGQRFQCGDVDAFGSINKRFRGIGLASIFGAYIIVWYYSVIIAWACIYFVSCFKSDLPFAGTTLVNTSMIATGICSVQTNLIYPIDYMNAQTYASTTIANCTWPKGTYMELPNKTTSANLPFALELSSMNCEPVISHLKPYLTILNQQTPGTIGSFNEDIECVPTYFEDVKEAKAKLFFYNDILKLSSSIDSSTSSFNGNLVGALFCVYLLMFCAVFKGVQSASVVVMITMPIPFLLLLILLIRGLYLPGAAIGIEQYLKWDTSQLGESEVWGAAVGQVFFSLGVCMGIMTAYSSYNPKTQNVVADNHIIALADTLASFFGGLVVYSVLGNLYWETQDESVFNSAGPGLTFITYPRALAAMPGSNWWGGLFFICLIMLGIDSAFSLVEAFATVITDRIGHTRQTLVIFIVCFVGFLLGLRFAVDSGYFWLDLVDHYINTYGMVFVGMMECLTVGWFYEKKGQREQVGPALDFFKWATIIITIIATALGLGLAQPVMDATGTVIFEGGLGGHSWFYAFWGAVVVWFVCIWISVIKIVNYRKATGRKEWLTSMILWELCGWHGPEMLRDMMNPPTDKTWGELTSFEKLQQFFDFKRVGIIWGWLIKYFIPPVLWLIFCATIRTDWYTPYEGYPMRFQAVGILIVVIMLLMIIFPMIEPELLKSYSDDESTTAPIQNHGIYSMDEKETKSIPKHDATKTDEENAKLMGA